MLQQCSVYIPYQYEEINWKYEQVGQCLFISYYVIFAPHAVQPTLHT